MIWISCLGRDNSGLEALLDDDLWEKLKVKN